MYRSIASLVNSKAGLGRAALFATFTLSTALSAESVLAQPTLTALKGSGQQTPFASVFPAPLVVWVTNPATERPVAGLRVKFTAGEGIGLSATYAITDERGLAAVSATGLVPCSSSVSAQIDGIPAEHVTFEGLVVNKAVLTVVPADVNANVDGVIPVITDYRIHGFVNGDTEETAHISGSPVLTTTAKDHSPHANYAIKGGVGTLSAPNYTFVAGFGTLAIVGGSNAADAHGSQLAVANPPADDAVVVRSAMTNRPETMTIQEPAFVAGLRGASGVFVRDAIWPEPLANSAMRQTASARSAMPDVGVDTFKVPEAAVRAVALPKLATNTGLQTLNPRSAIQMVVGSSVRVNDIPVRAVILPNSNASGQPVLAGPEIRQAFNPPGMK